MNNIQHWKKNSSDFQVFKAKKFEVNKIIIVFIDPNYSKLKFLRYKTLN